MQVVRNLTAMAAVMVTLTIAGQARSATLDFWLTQGECTGTCGAGTAPTPISDSLAAEGVINLISSTSATVTFTPPSGAKIDTPVYINLNNGGSTANVGVTLNIPGGTGFYSDTNGGQAEDHFGNMDLGSAGGFTICATGCTATSLVFTLTAENGFSWANVASVLMATTGYGAAYSQGFDAVEASFVESGVPNTQYAGFFTSTSRRSPALRHRPWRDGSVWLAQEAEGANARGLSN